MGVRTILFELKILIKALICLLVSSLLGCAHSRHRSLPEEAAKDVHNTNYDLYQNKGKFTFLNIGEFQVDIGNFEDFKDDFPEVNNPDSEAYGYLSKIFNKKLRETFKEGHKEKFIDSNCNFKTVEPKTYPLNNNLKLEFKIPETVQCDNEQPEYLIVFSRLNYTEQHDVAEGNKPGFFINY